MTEIGFVGLGKMGMPMARNLLSAGHQVAVWNRTAAKSQELEQLGARVAPTAADLATDVVVTVLTDLPDVIDVFEGPAGLLAGWQRAAVEDPVLVVMGTVSPTGVRAWGESVAREHGVRVVDAPVSGGDVGAQRRSLSIMVGGTADDVTRVMPALDAMGSVVRHLGELGSGQVAKSANQIIVAAGAIAIAEAMVYARESGLDMDALLELLQGGLADSEMLRQKGWRYLDRNYTGGGALANQVKDLRFALEQARALGMPLTGTAGSTEFFQSLVAMGHGELDHTAAQLLIETLSSREDKK